MKKFRIILIAAVVLLVALPPVFGMLTESQVRAQAESLRERGRLLVAVEQYDRGWFTSRALRGSSPIMGSSTTITSGRCTSAPEIMSFCRIP